MESSEAHPMNCGNGPYSYRKNSNYQKEVAGDAKLLINEAIAEKLDIENLSALNTFRIADLGCSDGPNTFSAVQNVINSVKIKYQSQGLESEIPEFQVFFSDLASNDFNTLFATLPADKPYYAGGVPGSFYGRLFPSASLHFVHSAFALQWLSKLPKEVVDKSSPAWNKGRIHYSNAGDEVVEAYSSQYAKDMDCFLSARAQEVVCGGLMVFIGPARPDGVPHSQAIANIMFEILGSCLMDMAKKGVLVEEKEVDSFNIPIYFTSPQELEAAVNRNGYFTVERMEALPRAAAPEILSKPQLLALNIRSGSEALIQKHFGHEIIAELFDLYLQKLEEAPSVYTSGKSIQLFALLKRKGN